MATKPVVNLDNDDDMEVYGLSTVARKIGQPYSGRLDKWLKNPEIETPKPTLKVNGEPMWDNAGVDAWKLLWDKETKRERELEEERLNSETVKKASLIEFLLADAKELASRNSRCYTHNRGNSMSDGRRRVIEFDGKEDFVRNLLGNSKIPAEKQQEINEFVRKAKSHVNMQ